VKANRIVTEEERVEISASCSGDKKIRCRGLIPVILVIIKDLFRSILEVCPVLPWWI
jgi:hypothetical protein